MVLGKKVQTQAEADMKTKKQAAAEPFAVVPLALMTFAQLGAALPPPRSYANSRQALIDYGFTLEEEAVIQARKKAESGSKPASLKRPLTSKSKTRK
jgi:hypothetical protein